MIERLQTRWIVKAVLAGIVTTVAASYGIAAGYPKPSPVPLRWELAFESGDVRLHVDPATGQAYWFFTYMVVNQTGHDQQWVPSFVLFSDKGEILVSGKGVPTRVTEELLEIIGNQFLEDQYEILGDILQGKEHAKEGLVVWPAQSVNVNELSLFIAGISGETARVHNPKTGEEVILRKTLQRDYLVSGNALARGTQPVELVSERWIMR